MIKSYGYTPHVRHLIGWIGTAQALFAPFGCFSVNIAAISAAISLDDQSHPDSRKRYIAGISCGLCYILMGIFAAINQFANVIPRCLYYCFGWYCLIGYDWTQHRPCLSKYHGTRSGITDLFI